MHMNRSKNMNGNSRSEKRYPRSVGVGVPMHSALQLGQPFRQASGHLPDAAEVSWLRFQVSLSLPSKPKPAFVSSDFYPHETLCRIFQQPTKKRVLGFQGSVYCLFFCILSQACFFHAGSRPEHPRIALVAFFEGFTFRAAGLINVQNTASSDLRGVPSLVVWLCLCVCVRVCGVLSMCTW